MIEPADNGNGSKRPSGFVGFCLEHKLIVILAVVLVVGWGTVVAPFAWDLGGFPRDPVPVDAIPDIGENQQIVFTGWPGRSPQDVEDQITYPLTISLLGVPGVTTVRSFSMFGFSTIYVVFDDGVEFYWARSRIMEKLSSLPPGLMPAGVSPRLGPDATALGQVFWYTLEGRDPDGNPAGGWDLQELRSVQDWYVRYGLMSAEGVSEVASIGGFVSEYQIDVDPQVMREYGVTLEQVYSAVRRSNVDIGARTIEVNRVEYVIRGLGSIEGLSDIEAIVIREVDNTPVRIRDVASVHRGPAERRGALDKGGAEAVGGVVVVRNGYNPLAAIDNVKARIEEISPGLPRKTLDDGTVSQITVVPFYDRTELIHQTLGTLNIALLLEILVTIIVVIVMVRHLAGSLLISGSLPVVVLMCFIAMKAFGVDANIVALSGIAIAIGTIVDMGIIVTENILKHMSLASPGTPRAEIIHTAVKEVAGAVLTAISTTVVSFLPVFAMTGPEGKLFKPLAYTKTFALVSSVIVALTVIPTVASIVLRKSSVGARPSELPERRPWFARYWVLVVVGVLVTIVLTREWMPIGLGRAFAVNLVFVVLMLGSLLVLFRLFHTVYPRILGWALANKGLFLLLPLGLIVLGGLSWSNLGREFMPSLDEGSFLWMPTTMPHASIGEALDVLEKQDMAFSAIPEVESVVGKIGRVDSALDPAPISMIETVINYKSEYVTDARGRPLRFKYDRRTREFVRDSRGELIEDGRGRPYRQWRPEIESPDDIWTEIVAAGQIPGTTSAPKLQPIETRLVMLQSGMRAPMGVKVKGPDLEAIERVSLEIERLLKEVPSIEAGTVIADRVVGKPYIEIDIDREAIARYGLAVADVQTLIETAVGGRTATTTIEGRERYPIRIRYARELRNNLESLGTVLVATPSGAQIPLGQLAEIGYVRGPQTIKSEDTFLVAYVTFGKKPGHAEVDVVEESDAYLKSKIESGELVIPAGVSYRFAGAYENQVRAQRKLALILPVALLAIVMILYLQFKSLSTTMIVFSGIAVAWAGGFILLWLYGQPWFLGFNVMGASMRDLFQVHPVNLSVAVWVGFLALFGIASDDGVVIATYLDQAFGSRRIRSVSDIREATIVGASRRIRPCLMTSATTILALLPVLTSTGRGADVMIPMALPSFGGMLVVLISVFVVPVLYSSVKERRFLREQGRQE